eukprot:3374811-Prymnesium_polylepis.1
MKKSKSKSKISHANIFKVSFVSGAGLSLKNEADRNGSQGLYYYLGIAIMILGSALGLGMGSSILFSEIFE